MLEATDTMQRQLNGEQTRKDMLEQVSVVYGDGRLREKGIGVEEEEVYNQLLWKPFGDVFDKLKYS